jgi:hypothetical protein
MKKLFIKFWPVITIISVWLTFSTPYFFQHKVPYPSKYQVTFFSPWSYYSEFAGPVKNNAMPDIIDQMYPWKYFTTQSFKHGQIPLWNPYNFAGNPHVANFQSAVFSPFNILFFILPFIDAWSILVLLQPLLAGLFMYLFMREVSVSKTGSVIGSISFMFCGFIVVWMAYGTLAMAISLLPLALFAIERVFNKKSLWALLLISIATFTSFFSGHVQTSLYFSIFTLLYVFFKLLTTKKIKTFFLVLGFFAIGLGITLIQVLPTLTLYGQSIRSNLVYPGGQIPLNYLVTLFAPDFYGNPVTRNDWMGSYAEWASFIGIIPFILVMFSLTKTKHKYNYFFAISGILALLFSSDTPLRQLLAISNIPVFATSIPSRMIVLFSFSFAVLSGFGFDNLQKLLAEKARKKIVLTSLTIGILLAIIWIILLFVNLLPADKNSLAVRNLILPTGMFIIFVLLNLFAASYHKKRVVLFVGIILIALTAFDSLRFATKWMPFDEKSLVYPDSAVVQALVKNISNARVFGNLGTQVESYYGIQSLEGYDPLYIGRYGEFIRSSLTGNYLSAERSVVKLDRRGRYTERVLDLLGVGIIFHPLADTNKEWAFPVWKDYKKYSVIYQDDKFQLYKNNSAMPRASLFYNFAVIPDGKNLLKKFYADDFDFRNILLLQENPNIVRLVDHKQPEQSIEQAKIVSYTPNKVVIEVNTDQPALLFLSDSYYPNWNAKVNGKEEKIYIADYAFRAVKVPSGQSKVEFEYSLF